LRDAELTGGEIHIREAGRVPRDNG
jgi:hypothetical protein